MKKPIGKGVALVVTLAGVVVLATAAFADVWCWGGLTQAPNVTPSDLTAEQRARVEAIQQDFAQRVQPLEERLAKEQADLEEYAASEKATIKGLKRRRAAIRKLEGQLEDLRLDAEGAVRKVVPNRGTFTYRGTGSPHAHGGYYCDWNGCGWNAFTHRGPGSPHAHGGYYCDWDGCGWDGCVDRPRLRSDTGWNRGGSGCCW